MTDPKHLDSSVAVVSSDVVQSLDKTVSPKTVDKVAPVRKADPSKSMSSSSSSSSSSMLSPTSSTSSSSSSSSVASSPSASLPSRTSRLDSGKKKDKAKEKNVLTTPAPVVLSVYVRPEWQQKVSLPDVTDN